MYNANEYAKVWNAVVNSFKNRTNTEKPMDLIMDILTDYPEDLVVETFAAVAQIKKYDGRIYGRNRDWMDSIAVDPVAVEWDRSNPMLRTDLDYIHTAHINQLITELRAVIRCLLVPERFIEDYHIERRR